MKKFQFFNDYSSTFDVNSKQSIIETKTLLLIDKNYTSCKCEKIYETKLNDFNRLFSERFETE